MDRVEATKSTSLQIRYGERFLALAVAEGLRSGALNFSMRTRIIKEAEELGQVFSEMRLDNLRKSRLVAEKTRLALALASRGLEEISEGNLEKAISYLASGRPLFPLLERVYRPFFEMRKKFKALPMRKIEAIADQQGMSGDQLILCWFGKKTVTDWMAYADMNDAASADQIQMVDAEREFAKFKGWQELGKYLLPKDEFQPEVYNSLVEIGTLFMAPDEANSQVFNDSYGIIETITGTIIFSLLASDVWRNKVTVSEIRQAVAKAWPKGRRNSTVLELLETDFWNGLRVETDCPADLEKSARLLFREVLEALEEIVRCLSDAATDNTTTGLDTDWYRVFRGSLLIDDTQSERLNRIRNELDQTRVASSELIRQLESTEEPSDAQPFLEKIDFTELAPRQISSVLDTFNDKGFGMDALARCSSQLSLFRADQLQELFIWSGGYVVDGKYESFFDAVTEQAEIRGIVFDFSRVILGTDEVESIVLEVYFERSVRMHQLERYRRIVGVNNINDNLLHDLRFNQKQGFRDRFRMILARLPLNKIPEAIRGEISGAPFDDSVVGFLMLLTPKQTAKILVQCERNFRDDMKADRAHGEKGLPKSTPWEKVFKNWTSESRVSPKFDSDQLQRRFMMLPKEYQEEIALLFQRTVLEKEKTKKRVNQIADQKKNRQPGGKKKLPSTRRKK